MIAEPGSAMIVELASQLAVPPYNRRHNPFITGLLFKNLRPGQLSDKPEDLQMRLTNLNIGGEGGGRRGPFNLIEISSS